MAIDRIGDLQDRLEQLYFLLKGLESAKDKASDDEKPRISLKITDQWQEIQAVEREYAQRLAQQIKREDLPELMAETILAEFVDEIEMIQSNVKNDEVRLILQQILHELQKPGVPAAAKLKVAIPIIPNVVSYEIEGDTENVIRLLFPTFVEAYKKIKTIMGK